MKPIPILAHSDPSNARQALAEPLVFGRVFADLMASARHDPARGWHAAQVGPFQTIPMSPAAKVLHYGLEIFEGHKAYRWPDGSVALFRHRQNAERLNASARRMAMPEVPTQLQIALTEGLVDQLRDWVPNEAGSSLYLRPTLIGTEPALGIGPAQSHLYFIIASPVGPYFSQGFASVSIRVDEKHIRAAPGGVGSAKTGGNYAAGLLAQEQAKADGFDQVLFLDALERRYLEELAGMNVFVLLDGALCTPPLGDTILAGITRRSLFECAADLGIEAREQPLAIDEVLADIRSGRLSEMMAVGTGAIITPIGELGVGGKRIRIGDGQPGPVTTRLYDTLTGIQQGQIDDPYGWMQVVEPARNNSSAAA